MIHEVEAPPMVECPDCDGEGWRVPVGAVRSRDWPDEPGSLPIIKCPDCRGVGLVPAE